jgi:hypothetical protein
MPPYICSAYWRLGFSRDQKLAAIITPPVKPSIVSKTARLIVLKKSTTDAPTAVISHVKIVANRAALQGPSSTAKFSNVSIIALEGIELKKQFARR